MRHKTAKAKQHNQGTLPKRVSCNGFEHMASIATTTAQTDHKEMMQ